MKWSNVRLILMREVRDQLRDRRTLFMIAVLPMLLYPMLGVSFLQVAQFMRESALKVLVVGEPQGENLPPLVEGDRFSAQLFSIPERARLLKAVSIAAPAPQQAEDRLETARAELQQGKYEAVIYFPPDFVARLDVMRGKLRGREVEDDEPSDSVPGPVIYYSTAKEASQIAYLRASDVLSRWTEAVGLQNLKDSHVPASAVRPFEIATTDVAEAGVSKAALWSKVLPFVLLLWALTGAFYPAVDLCAGEKERGTLETLLSSPAERSEIVWGKLLTIMLFSMATAVLNLASMGLTGALIIQKLNDFGPPPALAIVWLLLALVPVSALFSGLCLALAAFARSTKEGQYYLMPLVLVILPLTVLPMSPGVELNLGNSLIPVTGIMLLLRVLLEGNYAGALPYVVPVMAVTLVCCLLAVRWAADQFNSESVLFRESERLDMGLWLRHLMRDRDDTPSATQAVLCGVLMLVIRFFMSLALADTRDFVALALTTQLVIIATPALLMTIMLTRNPAKTLLLRLPRWNAVPAALLLAVTLHPLAALLRAVVTRVYPISEEMLEQLHALGTEDVSLGALLLVTAVVPAFCEELAFRGFILSGLRHLGHKWRAIAISSLFFGLMHPILQQSITATIIGVIIGFIAVQTGSLWPAIAFHMVHNSLSIVVATYLPPLAAEHSQLGAIGNFPPDGNYHFTWPVLMLSAVSSALLLGWFNKLTYARTAEESLQEAIEQHAPQSVLS